MSSYCIDIADDAFPFEATVTTSSGRVVNVSSSSSAYEAARAALATAWLMEGGYQRELPTRLAASDDEPQQPPGAA
jgi:hypothetical protein